MTLNELIQQLKDYQFTHPQMGDAEVVATSEEREGPIAGLDDAVILSGGRQAIGLKLAAGYAVQRRVPVKKTTEL
jgi:hypothetical protein